MIAQTQTAPAIAGLNAGDDVIVFGITFDFPLHPLNIDPAALPLIGIGRLVEPWHEGAPMLFDPALSTLDSMDAREGVESCLIDDTEETTALFFRSKFHELFDGPDTTVRIPSVILAVKDRYGFADRLRGLYDGLRHEGATLAETCTAIERLKIEIVTAMADLTAKVPGVGDAILEH